MATQRKQDRSKGRSDLAKTPYWCRSPEHIISDIRKSSMHPGAQAVMVRWVEEKKHDVKPQTMETRTRLIARFLTFVGKTPDEITKEDTIKFIDDYSKGKSFNTVEGMKAALRTFMRWNAGVKRRRDDSPECVAWIVVKKMTSGVTRESLVTDKEKARMYAAMLHDRDRALFALMERSGARPEEVVGMAVKDIENKEGTKDGAKVFYFRTRIRDGKTGDRMAFPLAGWAYSAVKKWINEGHPLRNDPRWPDVPLFVTARHPHNALTMAAAREVFYLASRRAGLERRVSPKLFRHTWITAAYKGELGTKLTPPVIKTIIGHSPKSHVTEDVYSHLCGTDAENACLDAMGIETKQTEGERLMLCFDTCTECGASLPPGTSICKCGLAIGPAAVDGVGFVAGPDRIARLEKALAALQAQLAVRV